MDLTEVLIDGYDELNPATMEQIITELTQTGMIVIIKFSAVWCRPCQEIKEYVNEYVNFLPKEKIVWVELDIDETLDFYMYLKTKRMLKGVPSILAWFPNKNREQELWYIPDDSVSGSDKNQIKMFFDRCIYASK